MVIGAMTQLAVPPIAPGDGTRSAAVRLCIYANMSGGLRKSVPKLVRRRLVPHSADEPGERAARLLIGL